MPKHLKAGAHNGQAGGNGDSLSGQHPPPASAGALVPSPATNDKILSMLSPLDQKHYEQLQRRLQVVRDRVTAVALGYSTGLFLWGPGGVGKSFTALETLKALRASFVVFNSRMTGWGLFERLKEFPDAVHVLEDMERIMRDTMAQGVLRSATWGQRQNGDRGPQERLVTWNAHGKIDRVIFSGGIVMNSNRDVLNLPEWQAIGTRIDTLHLQASENELRALMRYVSLKGFEHDGREMEPEECVTVCEYLIDESLSLNCTLDMRLLVKAFQNYLMWQEGDAACDWKDLVAAQLRKRPGILRLEVSWLSRADRKRQEQQIVREILDTTSNRAEQLELWRERTEKSRAAFDRRKGELNQA